jgi:hypothetical protein
MRGASAQQVPYSSGTEAPKLKAPANACDCHMHIYDAKYPAAPSATLKPPDALVADYKLLQKRIGTTRNVIVTPSTYGTDNRVTLDAMAQIGATARGVAVVDTSVADADLKRMNDLGIRGIRFNLVQAGATTVEMIEPLSKRVNDLGWHIQIHMKGEQIAGIEDLLLRVPSPIVFDHLGRLAQPNALDNPGPLVAGEIESRCKVGRFFNSTFRKEAQEKIKNVQPKCSTDSRQLLQVGFYLQCVRLSTVYVVAMLRRVGGR